MSQQRISSGDVKAKHRAMWALGDYPAVATDVIPSLGPVFVKATGIAAGDHVLDVAAGSGNASLPAAENGAHVVASDLTPELLDSGREQAKARGLTVQWGEADCEQLPFRSVAFDAVISCVGVLVAPRHQKSAGSCCASARGPDRPAELDTDGVHRADVRGDEALGPTAASRCATATAVGQMSSTYASCSVIG